MKDPRIDKYIASSAEFARPILDHLRVLVHQACPEVEEKMKWSFQHYDYKGVFVSMAAFKEHCAFSFWKAKLLPDPHNLLQEREEKAMGHFGKIRSLEDLPPDKVILEYLIAAMKLNEAGIKLVPKKPSEKEKKELRVPPDLIKALSEHPKASETFEKFSYSNKKEYVEWITEAKTEATRRRRLETAVEWMDEGKARNWKYK